MYERVVVLKTLQVQLNDPICNFDLVALENQAEEVEGDVRLTYIAHRTSRSCDNLRVDAQTTTTQP